MVKFQYGLAEHLRLGIRYVPWAHESTHLGDEYVIIAQRPSLQPPFERINVSYESQEYGVSLEGHNLFRQDDEWTVRHGGIDPWGPDGYYSDHLLGSNDPVLTPSRKNYEPSFGLQYLFPPWGRPAGLSVLGSPATSWSTTTTRRPTTPSAGNGPGISTWGAHSSEMIRKR